MHRMGRGHRDREQLLHAVLQSCAPTVFVYVQFGTDNPTIKRFFIGHAMRRRWQLAIEFGLDRSGCAVGVAIAKSVRGKP
jgi:hypothetical protein